MKLKSSSKDIFGLAVESYFLHKDQTPIVVQSENFYDDQIPVEYLFRTYKEMPELEQIAIDSCHGKVLDVGCCAGSHSLELKSRGHDILPIDISEKCIQTCHKRGLKTAEYVDFFSLKEQKFDTILLLMNGIGIAQTVENLPIFFQKLKSLMHKESQVILDSSDLIFLYKNELIEDNVYYGELTYITSYKDHVSNPFNWLYLDFELLKSESNKQGLLCELVFEDNHYGFLARLKLN